MDTIVHSAADISLAWLNYALKPRLKTSVTSFVLEPIGAGVGLMAELARLRLEYAGPEDLPPTMIVKCTSQNENKQVAQVLDFYNREVNFYNRMGDDCGLRVPASYYGAIVQETYEFVILMEDLGDVSPHDQVVGANEQEAYTAIDNIAKMHVRYWGQVNDDINNWMFDVMSMPESEKLRDLLYVPGLEPTIKNFPDFFTDETRRVCRAVGQRFPEFWSTRLSNFETFIHGDYRQDNFIYEVGTGEAIVMDWQISGKGKPIFDITYFMCQSLRPELRLKLEKDLIRRYVGHLEAAGITEYDFDTAFRDYRLNILGCLVYPITVAGTLDLANKRGLALAECMLERNLQAIIDLNCAELLD